MRWILIACVAIVAFDAITAVAAKALNFGYTGFPWIIGSTAIYAFPAVMAARDGQELRMSALAGAAVALVDATIGWAVGWIIGPGAPPPGSGSPEVLGLAVIAVVVVTVGAGIGLAAGLVTRRFARRSSAGS